MARSLASIRYRTNQEVRAGHFIASEKGRMAYEVVRIVSVKNIPLGGRRWRKWSLRCNRHPRSMVPEGAVVHSIKWDKRS